MFKLKAPYLKRALFSATALVMLFNADVYALPFDQMLKCKEVFGGSHLGSSPDPDVVVIEAEMYLSCEVVASEPPPDPMPRVSGDGGVIPRGPAPRIADIADASCSELATRSEDLLALYRQLNSRRDSLDKLLNSTLTLHTAAKNALHSIQTQALAAAQQCDAATEFDEDKANIIAHEKCKKKKKQAYMDCRDEVFVDMPINPTTQQACTAAAQQYSMQRRAESVESGLKQDATRLWNQRADAARDAGRIKRQLDRYNAEIKARCN